MGSSQGVFEADQPLQVQVDVGNVLQAKASLGNSAYYV